jgi:metal-dependent hydrolase (beta-lactamase superfamily II)
LPVGSGSVQSTADANADPAKTEITVMYDAFGRMSAMQKDWGYAALVEYGGKDILFDIGSNPDILAQNAKAKGMDLTKLDFVVMSHRHGGGPCSFLPGLGWFAQSPKSTRVWQPTLSWNQLRSLTRPQKNGADILRLREGNNEYRVFCHLSSNN